MKKIIKREKSTIECVIIFFIIMVLIILIQALLIKNGREYVLGLA